MIKKIFVASLVFLSLSGMAQKPAISVDEATRLETFLASDDLAGRKPGTPGMQKAADFISEEFRKAGLQPLPGSQGFLQEFSIMRPKLLSLKAEADGADMDVKNVVVVTTKKELKVNEKDQWRVIRITRTEVPNTSGFGRFVQRLLLPGQPAIVLVDTAFSSMFLRITGIKRNMMSDVPDLVFILGTEVPKTYTIKAEHSFDEVKLANVVGMLPGKSRKDEQVIFSGHYDHLGIGKPVDGDSIYNGANDDASGISSVILLAQHFAKKKDNERSLLFAAFTSEESGGFGANYFSRQLTPDKVMAMFNIEMIGTESKWGRNSAYITGFDKSSMGAILQASLKGSGFDFYPDPYPEQNLFYRSDNATLARLGVPAHTISTSKMDVEPHYHKPSDEVGTLDMANLAKVTEAIAVSAATIISAKETPTRVKE
jgi:hypothetical protein